MVLKAYLYEMSKRKKIIVISLISIVAIGVLTIVVAQNVISSKIKTFLAESLPNHIKVDYEDLSFAILSGNLELEKPKLTIYGKTTDSINLTNQMSSLLIEDVGYWDYIFNDKISIESIKINNPKIDYYHNKLVDSKDYKSSAFQKSTQNVTIGKVMITNGNLQMFDGQTDSLLLKTDKFTSSINNVVFDTSSSQDKIPIAFSNYDISFENLFYVLNDYDNLEVRKSRISSDSCRFDGLSLYTKYSKEKLSRIIPVERDHFDLKVDAISFHQNNFGFHKDSVFYFKSPNVTFSNPALNIYRDKLVTDDATVKSMYSKMLRNLGFELSLDKVLLKNTFINYSEKVKLESSAGHITFSSLNATIENLGNTYSKKTTIDIDALFMKSTPINVQWSFDVNNVNDHFVFKADVGKLPAKDLNSFSEPNLKVKFEGELLKTYFTIDGNFHDSNVALKTNYDDFKVEVLEKDGKEKNKLLSAIANLFIKNDSDKEPDDFREGSKKNVERDKTKSVFNFLWLNARAGLLNAMTGNGKK